MKRLAVTGIVLVGALLLVVAYWFLKWDALERAQVNRAAAALRICQIRYMKYPNYEQYHAKLKLPQVSAVSQQEWAKRFQHLKIGMAEEEVERLMDEPDYAQCYMSKEGTRFRGSGWVYEVVVQEDGANDKKNSLIHILFDPDGKLKDKDAFNIEGVSSKPVPQPTN